MRISKGWGSHLPVLIKLLAQTDGPVLELGAGLYSTPFLHWACFGAKRKLVSYDTSKEWFGYTVKYREDFHEVHFVEEGGWDAVDIEKPWDVVLVDQHPDIRRHIDIARLANHAKYIVVHDTDVSSEAGYNYDSVRPLFKYQIRMQMLSPETSIFSNFVDVTTFTL